MQKNTRRISTVIMRNVQGLFIWLKCGTLVVGGDEDLTGLCDGLWDKVLFLITVKNK